MNTPIDYILGTLFTIFLLVMLCGILWASRYEKKVWNNGRCAKCGADWKSFDMDSQGGRGYKCECPGPEKYMWMSYGWDNKKKPVPTIRIATR